MTRARNKPETLVQGTSAATRRALVDVQSANGEPTLATDGVDTGHNNWIHLTLELPDAGTALEWKFWEYDEIAELWRVRADVGTQVLAVADSPDGSTIEIAGAHRVYIQLLTFTGTFTVGASGWLSGSSF